MIFALLKTDQETLSKMPPGEAPPAPLLYDPQSSQEASRRSLSLAEAWHPAEKDSSTAKTSLILTAPHFSARML
jgi:hypothetical protein